MKNEQINSEEQKALSDNDNAFSNPLFKASKEKSKEQNKSTNKEKPLDKKNNDYLFDSDNKKKTKNPFKSYTAIYI